jgi:nicotinamidase-related amidase
MGPERLAARQPWPGAFLATSEHAGVHQAGTALVVVSMTSQRPNAVAGGLLKYLTDRGVDCRYFSARADAVAIPNSRLLMSAFLRAGAAVALVQVSQVGHIPQPDQRRGRTLRPNGDDERYDVIATQDSATGSLTMTKIAPGGFAAPDLDQHLRRLGVQTVFYAGFMTTDSVLLTMTSGLDRGFHGCLVTDATAALTQPLQVAGEAAAASIGQCVTSKEAIAMLTRAPSVAHGSR